MPSTDPRGVKRKHSFLLPGDDNSKMRGKLFHGLKKVKKVAKKAKAFESRKIVRRLRASGASPEISVLEAELDALKTVDHDRIGTLALKCKLKNDKLLSSNPSIQSAVSETFTSDVIHASESTAAKLESRLLSSKMLSKEVNMVISSLYSALNPSGDEGGSYDEATSRSHEPQIVDSSAVANQPGALEACEDKSDGSGDDTSDSSGPAKSGSPFQPSTSTLPPRFHDRAGHSPLLPGDASRTLETESVFLPTLSNGFIPGDSETDWSDGEVRAADGIRRNRRGQRARRAIWEKKYGKRAKHLQMREATGATCDAFTPRKHSKGPEANHQRLPYSPKPSSRTQQTETVSKKEISSPRKSRAVDDRPLHPSWVAKLRMKERSSAVIVPSQGKRIKFDG